jgi:hypothetical protein
VILFFTCVDNFDLALHVLTISYVTLCVIPWSKCYYLAWKNLYSSWAPLVAEERTWYLSASSHVRCSAHQIEIQSNLF